MKDALKWLDANLGPLAARFFARGSASKAEPPAEARSILLVRPGGIGDAVLTAPLICALAARYKGASIDILAERRNAGAYAIGPLPVSEIFLYDKTPFATFRALKKKRYDLVIDTEQFHVLSTVYVNRLSPRFLIGYDTAGRAPLLDRAVSYSEGDYEVHSFMRLYEALTGETSAFNPDAPFLRPFPERLLWAKNALAPADGKPVAAVMCSAGAVQRLWPVDRLAEASQYLAQRGFAVLLVGGGDAVARAGEVKKALPPGAALDFTGKASLAQTAALFSLSALCFTPDTSTLHIAYAVGTPTVSIFGSGVKPKWAPPGKLHIPVTAGLECSPCTKGGRTPPCPRKNECMRLLTVEMVKEALDELIAKLDGERAQDG